MITPKQAEGRRNNSKLSTGPRTPMGKANTSRNPLKHGFRARTLLVPGESETELASFRSGIQQTIAPAGAIESLPTDCMVDAAWQMRRLPAIVSQILTSELYAELALQAGLEAVDLKFPVDETEECEKAEDPDKCRETVRRKAEMRAAGDNPATALGRAFMRCVNGSGALSVLSRYQVTMERSLFRCLHEIQRLQAARAGAVDMNVFLPNKATEVLESKD